MNVGNNWPFCHAKTQISFLNSLGSVKYWKMCHFGAESFFSVDCFEKTCLNQHTNVKEIVLELWGWSQMTGNFSKIIHLPKNLRKIPYLLRLSMVLDNCHQNPECQSNKNHSNLPRCNQVTRGHNIVWDGWAGGYNPNPHPCPPQTHAYR